jgi:hypothetical protein
MGLLIISDSELSSYSIISSVLPGPSFRDMGVIRKMSSLDAGALVFAALSQAQNPFSVWSHGSFTVFIWFFSERPRELQVRAD